ncbi:MAG: hypothetical protein HYV07_06705 [Deltaproteobacteria bacterium]|nr:hypothetical protein [Deltaproteobacteria bacterium]
MTELHSKLNSLGGRLLAGFAIAVSLTCAAHAENLVKMEGGKAQPSIVTAWSGDGKKIELDVREGTEPQAVADSIRDAISKVKVSVKGSKVLVIGMSQDELLAELAKVELAKDDFGAIAAATKVEGDDLGSGSSLRAKKSADLAAMFKDQTTTAQGRVVKVAQGAFPDARVTVQILAGPTGDLGKTIRKGSSIVFAPVMKLKDGKPDWANEDNQLNLGAYFLKEKDNVRVKIGKESKGAYEAVIIERQ